ncbi:LIV-II [Serratia rubidaea]|uniref:Branched-chain amino acid transport system carrier protein n=1 Tax=Serratia rubidaea TaxID=61652 RepID=A0A4U9HAV3_SERRU|nr:LIV-II [Serratia rubidaea]
MFVSNLGLSHLIHLSIPVLTAIYPPCIVLVVLSFTMRMWNSAPKVIAPVMLVSLLFGILDAVKAAGFENLLPAWSTHLPLAGQGIGMAAAFRTDAGTGRHLRSGMLAL